MGYPTCTLSRRQRSFIFHTQYRPGSRYVDASTTQLNTCIVVHVVLGLAVMVPTRHDEYTIHGSRWAECEEIPDMEGETGQDTGATVDRREWLLLLQYCGRKS